MTVYLWFWPTLQRIGCSSEFCELVIHINYYSLCSELAHSVVLSGERPPITLQPYLQRIVRPLYVFDNMYFLGPQALLSQLTQLSSIFSFQLEQA